MAEPVLYGPEGWPPLGLTWAEEVVRWCAEHLRQPDGPEAGRPWRPTRQQMRFLAWWFAHDEQGRWLYRRGVVRMCKGWGKDPLAAVLALVELVGPARPGIRDGGAPGAWVQVVAVSRDQTRTTMRLFPGLLPERTRERYGIEVNKELVYAHGGRAVIEAVTSSPDSLEGARATLTVCNEIQNWRAANQGHAMAAVIAGNLAKGRGGASRVLSLCNAHVPGEDTVAEREWDAYQAIRAGRARISDVLYVAQEAPPETDLADEASLRAGLEAARGDAVWLDIDRLVAEVWDPRTAPSEARRKYLNQIVAAEDSWLAPHEWRACRVEAHLEEGEAVTLGFDGSKTDDHTALVACRVEDGCLFTLGVWDPGRHGGEAPREEIDAAVRRAFEAYDVVGFYADLHPWESYVDRWASELGERLCVHASRQHPVAWDMRARQAEFTRWAERFHDAVVERALRHDGDPRLEEHVLNARRRPNRWGVSFGKETRDSSRKVDAAAAAVLARAAWSDYRALPPARQRRKRTGRAMFV
ncbi:MAG TPA: terminase [Actinomycetota bacterium]|nr:terminase [Actinomycetota bacterium]